MNKNIEDIFKDYVPEILEFDKKVDGSDEHKTRNELLNTKEKLLKAIQDKQANKRVFRQPIRTENEKT